MISLVVGDKDVSELASKISWTGDYKQCARILSVSIAATPYDESVPTVDAAPGTAVTFSAAGKELFSGFVVKRQRSTKASVLTVKAYDRGFYLNKNEIVRQYRETTPEAVAADLCAEFGVQIGSLAPTGYTFSRNFIGVSAYKAIMTGYTLASGSTGKKYQARFEGNRFSIVEVGANETTLVIQGESNLQDATYSDSIEKSVTEVAIYDKNADNAETITSDLQPLYGTIRKVIQQAKGKESEAADKAQSILEESGLSQTATVECLGNVQNISGNTVVVKEPYTGLYGLFWIEKDLHEWKNGVYYNRLTLSFRELMDVQEVGSLPNKDGKKTSAPNSKKEDSTESLNISTKKWEAMKNE